MEGMMVANVIEKARSGDRVAAECLWNLLRERVQRTAGHYANRTGMEREDLQQEMWLGMLMGLQQVDLSIGDPLCYLFLRGKWRLLEAIRRSQRESAEALDAEAPLPDHRRFEDEVCARWMTRRLADGLRGPQRAILLGLLAGQRQEEMAQSLGCTAANVSYHVRKIREGFRSLSTEN